MEKHTNKIFAGVLALSCAFILGACDPVEALPNSYNDPILEAVQSGEKVDTKDNIMGTIYDSISGNKNEKVLQKILDEVANKKYGTYTDIMDACTSTTKMNEYMASHKEVFEREDDGSLEGATKEEIREARFNAFAEDIKERVSEQFYNLITSGAYNDEDTGMFNEENLYTKLSEELWDLQDLPSGDEFKKFYVTSELTKKNALSWLNSGLYSRTGKISFKAQDGTTDLERDARGYIEEKVFPQILKDKLVEEYIYNNNYASLGRSYARKVNYVKVSYNDSSLDYARYLMKSFAKDYVYKTIDNDNPEKLNFDIIDKAVRGFEKINTSANATNPLIEVNDTTGTYSSEYAASYTYNASFQSFKDKVIINPKDNVAEFTTVDGTILFDTTKDQIEIFADTKLGELLESYNKAIAAKAHGFLATDEEKAELEKFDSGKSTADVLRSKIIDLAKQDNTVDGWFVKSGGITELPSALRDRLFNINVANDLDKADGYFLETSTTYGNYRFVDNDSSKAKLTKVPYVRNIEGRKLIMPTSVIDWELDNDNFIYSDDSAFYIVQVLEAPSTPKLNVESTSSAYTKGDKIDVIRIESIAREIAKVLSTKDTYITNAYTKYLENYVFVFGDTSLYDYLKGQYPDLFDDED